jgi:hypothetical protein
MTSGWRARYEIRLEGSWECAGPSGSAGWRWMESDADETILSETISDRSALHGLLDRVRDLGMSLISVRRLPPEESDGGP